MKTICLVFSGIILLSGCTDPVKVALNKNWPPINTEQQRQAAIESASNALAKMPEPNIAVAVKLSDAERALLTDDLKMMGINSIELIGEKQLIHMNVKFSRQFSESDAGDNGELRNLLRFNPDISGSISLYAGLSSTLLTQTSVPQLELRLLPAISAVKVDNIKLREKIDATKAGNLFAQLLNKYKENISSALSQAAFARVTIPALLQTQLDLNNSFKVSSSEIQTNVVIKANPATISLKIDAVAWHIDNKTLTALAQLIPIESSLIKEATIPPTYDAISARTRDLIKTSFDFQDYDDSTWVAIRKDLLAFMANKSAAQAKICISASAEMPSQKTINKIPMPDPDAISCSQNYPCEIGNCPYSFTEDTRGCGKFDMLCEGFKTIENARRRLQAEKEVGECRVAEELKRIACEKSKAAAQGVCDLGKAGLRLLGPDLARIETEVKLKTNDAQVCLQDFTLSSALNKVQFTLDVQGKAVANINAKYAPLGVGHLVCIFPWTRAQTFEASLRESRFDISAPVKLITSNEDAQIQFEIERTPIKVKLYPGPTEFLINNPQMVLSCPVIAHALPITIALTPFIKELQGEIDIEIPAQNTSIDLNLPIATIGGASLTPKLLETARALIARDNSTPSK